jgi:protoheme IX farnesyltransferase
MGNGLISDVKALIKAGVLFSNILPVFTGFWLAIYFTDTSFADHFGVFLLVMIGSTLVMAGALILNNWYDVDIDRLMTRTRHRPTVTGAISFKLVLILGVSSTVVGLICLLFTTFETFIYAFIGWFTYVVLYTMWSKRKYTLNTFIGSVSGAVTPLIGWAAIEPASHIVPMVLFLILFIWQMPHTFAIAMKKCEEYRVAGVMMLPVVHGFKVAKRQIVIHVALLLPLPFYLTSLGTSFVVIATLLNITWLAVSIYGFYSKDDLKWAHTIFIYSVNYITILFVIMIIVTFPLFG